MQRPGHSHATATGATFGNLAPDLNQLHMVGIVPCSPVRAAGLKVHGPHLAHGHSLNGCGRLGCGFVCLLLALYLSGVLPVIQHHGKAAGFGAGLFNAPQLHVPDGAADGLPV